MEIIYGVIALNSGIIKQEYTESQALQEDYYAKITKINGQNKKIEFYSDQKLFAITHYLDAGEDESQLVSVYSQLVVSVTIIYRRQPLGGYFIEVEKSYEEDEILYAKRLFDDQGRLICYQRFTNETQPFLLDMEKYFYMSITTEVGNPQLTDYHLRFFYHDETGELLDIEWYLGHNINESFQVKLIDSFNDIDEVITKFGSEFSMQDFNYYTHPNIEP